MTPTPPAPGSHEPPRPRAGGADADRLLAQALALANERVRHWARRQRLQPADVDDAREGAAVAVLKAMRAYDPAQVRGPAESSLRALVGRVVSCSLSDFLRARRRLARHYDPSADVVRLLEGEAPGRGEARPVVRPSDDPARLAEWHEQETAVAVAVGSLPAEYRQVYDLRLSGKSLREMAAQLGVTVKVVRGRLEKVREKLAAAHGAPHGWGRGAAPVRRRERPFDARPEG